MNMLNTQNIAKVLIAFMLLSLSLLSFSATILPHQENSVSSLSTQQWHSTENVSEHCQNSSSSQQCNSGNAYAVISQQNSFNALPVINSIEVPLKPYLNAKLELPFKPPK